MSEKKPVVRRDVKVSVAFPPVVTLLPPEVGERKSAARARGRAIFVALLALGIAVLVATGANLYALQRAATLEDARAQTLSLITEQGEYENVRLANQQLISANAARVFIASTEISTNGLIEALGANLSGGMTITAYSLETANPLQTYSPSLSPIDPESIATLTVAVSAPSVAAVAAWIRTAPSIEGIVDGSVTRIEWNEDGFYEATVSVFVGADALLHRFEEAPLDEEPAANADSESEPSARPAPSVGINNEENRS